MTLQFECAAGVDSPGHTTRQMCIDTLRDLLAELEILGGTAANALIRKSLEQQGNIRDQTIGRT
jgi:hypothetical protein